MQILRPHLSIAVETDYGQAASNGRLSKWMVNHLMHEMPSNVAAAAAIIEQS